MKFEIIYRTYRGACDADVLLNESFWKIRAQSLEIEDELVAAWTEYRRDQWDVPDVVINANDVLTIKPIMEE